MNRAYLSGLADAGAASEDKATGRRCLNVPVGFLFSQDLTAGQSRVDLSQTVDADADFYWRGWKWFETGAAALMTARFGLLNGYYLSNAQWPMVQLNQRSITPEIRITAGGFIRIEATNGDVATRRLKILFWGVKRYFRE